MIVKLSPGVLKALSEACLETAGCEENDQPITPEQFVEECVLAKLAERRLACQS